MRDITPRKSDLEAEDSSGPFRLDRTDFALQLLKILAAMAVEREEHRLLSRKPRTNFGSN